MAVDRKIVVNELLCLLFNHIHSIPFDDLLRCCAKFYGTKEIVAAKDLLFDAVNHPSKRKITRKASSVSKEVADVTDILNLALECDAENVSMPLFVAANLSNLPPVPVNSGDINSVYKDISAMKESIANLCSMVESKPSYADVARSSVKPIAPSARFSPPPVDGASSSVEPCSTPPRVFSAESAPLAAPQFKKQRMGRLNRNSGEIVGAAVDAAPGQKQLKASVPRKSFYVGRFEIGTKEEDVAEFLGANRPDVKVQSVEQLPNRDKYEYCAFRVTCVGLLDNAHILDASLWPAGIRCRVFYERSLKVDRSASADKQTKH